MAQYPIGQGIEASIQMEYAHVPMDFSGEIAGLVSLVATQRLDEENARAPCDLSLVIDKSGSMDGAKLKLVVQACKFVLAQLTDTDRLGIVLYDTQVSELFPLSYVDADTKRCLTAKLDEVRSGSATNLSGGLLKGLQQHAGARVFPWIFSTDEPRVVDLAVGHHVNEENNVTTAYVKLEAGEDVIEKVRFEVAPARNSKRMKAPKKNKMQPNLPIMQTNMMQTNMLPMMQMNEVEQVQNIEEEFEIVQMPQQAVPVPPLPDAPAEVTSAPFQTVVSGRGDIKIIVTFKDGSERMYEHKLVGSGSQTTQRVRFVKPEPSVKRDAARSVFLLTDGIANNGITSTSGIIAAAKGALAQINSNCTVNCFGFGDDHCSDMLSALASACGGDYLYIETEESIATAFAHALGGLLSVVAQNIVVNVDCDCVSKYPDFKREGNKIELGDMFADEHRDLVFHFSPAAHVTNLGSVRVSYFNLVTNLWEETESVSLTLQRGDTLSAVNPTLAFHRARVNVVDTLKRAKEYGDNDRMEDARACIQSELERLEASDDSLMASLIPQLADVQNELVDVRAFKSKGKKKMDANIGQSRKQRAMGAEGSAYTNICQTSMQQAAKSFF